MGVGGRADHDRLDVRPSNRRHWVAHRLGAESLGKRLDRRGEWIGDGNELGLGVRRDVGGVDLADATGGENCYSNNRFSRLSVIEALCARLVFDSVGWQLDEAELLHRRVECPLRRDLERQVAMVGCNDLDAEVAAIADVEDRLQLTGYVDRAPRREGGGIGSSR